MKLDRIKVADQTNSRKLLRSDGAKEFEKEGAASGEKKNERDKGYAHEFERCSAILGIANATDSYAAALPVSSRRY